MRPSYGVSYQILLPSPLTLTRSGQWPPPLQAQPAYFDGTVVDDDCFVDGADNGGGDGHVLDGEVGAVCGVVLTGLRGVVEVFFLLNGCLRGFGDGTHAGEPFDASVDRRLGQTVYVSKAVDEHTTLQCSQTPQLVASSHEYWAVASHSFPKPA